SSNLRGLNGLLGGLQLSTRDQIRRISLKTEFLKTLSETITLRLQSVLVHTDVTSGRRLSRHGFVTLGKLPIPTVQMRPSTGICFNQLPIFLPILYLIINISIGIFSIYDSPKDALLSVGLIALGIPVYIFGVAWKRKPALIESAMYRTTVWLQKVFNVVQQEASPDCIEVSP
ncbi:uncharacterized protein DEA37_0006386, partial [Paragonimus westermani]